jgi:hypothetical protein
MPPASENGGDPIERALIRATDDLYRDDRVSDTTWRRS